MSFPSQSEQVQERRVPTRLLSAATVHPASERLTHLRTALIAMGQAANVGATSTNSIAIGSGSTIAGANSTIVGAANIVTGNNSGAFGTGQTVNGNGSYGIGDPNTINGNNSFVLGNNNTINGPNVPGNGDNVQVVGSNNTVASTTSSSNSSIVGLNNTVNASAALVFGNTNTVTGFESITVAETTRCPAPALSRLAGSLPLGLRQRRFRYRQHCERRICLRLWPWLCGLEHGKRYKRQRIWRRRQRRHHVWRTRDGGECHCRRGKQRGEWSEQCRRRLRCAGGRS